MKAYSRKLADKLGCDWDRHEKVFRIADGEGPPLKLTPDELVELGVELVLIGTNVIPVFRQH